MPIDSNLANWNKENEPSEKRTPTNCRRSTNVQQVMGAPSRRSGQLKTPAKSSPLSPERTPKPQPVSILEKSRLKRGIWEEEQHRWFKIQQVFSCKHSHTDQNMDKSGDEQELMDELLHLCSWFSEGEQTCGAVKKHCPLPEENQEEDKKDTPLFHEFANYLAKLSQEVEPVQLNSRKESRREVLMPVLTSDSDFDLNASF